MKRFNKPAQARAAPALSARPLPRAENDGLRPFPLHRAAGLGQAVQAFADGQEVVAGQLARLTSEAGGAIGDQNFRLTQGTGMDNDQLRQGFMGSVAPAGKLPRACRLRWRYPLTRPFAPRAVSSARSAIRPWITSSFKPCRSTGRHA